MSEPLAPELEAKAQELAARIKARSADAILEMARRLVATTDESLFGDTEFALRDRAQGIVADAYACHLPQNGIHHFRNRLPPLLPTRPLPRLSRKNGRNARRAGHVQPRYYYCGLCAKGSCPWDQRVGLTTHRLSPAVERLATLCGAVADSFEKGTELLQETAGVRLSESTVERTTETTGQRIAEHVQKGHLRWQRTVELGP